MTATTNAENFRKYKSRLSFIVEQILAFASSHSMVREVEHMFLNFKKTA